MTFGSTFRIGLVSILCLAPGFNVEAQNIRTSELEWKINEVIDLHSGSVIPTKCEFTTNSDLVIWVQKEGAIRSEYSILSIDGEWNDINLSGSVLITLSRNGRISRMEIARSSGETTIVLSYLIDNQFTAKIKYRVSSVALK